MSARNPVPDVKNGPLVQVWYDAAVKSPVEGGPDVLPIFERNQPDSPAGIY